MKIKQKTVLFFFGLLLSSCLCASLLTPSAFADPATTTVKCKDGKKVTAKKDAAKPNNILDEKDYNIACKKHGGYTAPKTPKDKGGDKKDSTPASHTCGSVATYFDFGCGNDKSSSDQGGKDNPIVKVLASFVKILTGGIGLVAIGGVVTGGIIYSTASGNAETAKKGLSFIFNSVLGLALYAFLVTILNFAIPGGLF